MRIATADVPGAVVAAFDARFPHASLVESELALRGGALVYNLTAEDGGHAVEVALSPSGRVVGAGPAVAVEIIDFGLTTADPGDVVMSPLGLPNNVAAAVEARFPGAKLIRAEYSTADGAPEFAVTAELDGREVDATLTSGGDITETGQSIQSSELPRAVVDWVRQNFAGAAIDQAATIYNAGLMGYQVSIAGPGRQEFEATLNVHGREDPRAPRAAGVWAAHAPAPTVPAGETPSGSDTPSGPESDDPSAHSTLNAAHASGVVVVAVGPTPVPSFVGRPSRDTQGHLRGADVGQENRGLSKDDAKAGAERGHSVAVADAARGPFAGAGPAAWLPRFAGALCNVLPNNAILLEQGLREVLRQIDLLSENIQVGRPTDGSALRLVTIAVLAVGAQVLLLVDPRRRPTGPLLLSAATSGWSRPHRPSKRPRSLARRRRLSEL